MLFQTFFRIDLSCLSETSQKKIDQKLTPVCVTQQSTQWQVDCLMISLIQRK